MTVFRCRICGKPYLGSQRPTHCPFCGAHQKHLLPAAEYQPPAIIELGRQSRENLEKALERQLADSKFYRGASKVADTEQGRALFQALEAHQAEHVAVIGSMLGVPLPEELGETGECSPAHKENLAEARRREERLVRHYRKCYEKAEEDRVREVAEALAEIATDHLGLTE